jgi:hypothetical protein
MGVEEWQKRRQEERTLLRKVLESSVVLAGGYIQVLFFDPFEQSNSLGEDLIPFQIVRCNFMSE